MKRPWIAAAAAAFVLAAGGASYADDLAPAPATSSAPAAGYSATGTWQLLAQVNSHRRSLGLRPLTVDSRLAGIARGWAERMAASSSLRHNDGLFSPASHRSLDMNTLGENVGWNYSVREQDAAYLHSPGHKANIERAGFRVVGFAVVRAADGRLWSTEDFGTPAP